MNENTNPDVKTIENATGDDVRPGDHITWEQTEVRKGVTRTVRREGIALTLRRPVPVEREE